MCDDEGNYDTEAHHDDYAKPREVRGSAKNITFKQNKERRAIRAQ